MLQRLSFFICVMFFCVSLTAQPSERFRWNPYSATVLPPQQYQIFMGRLPRFLGSRDIISMFGSVTGVSIRITQYNAAEGYAFLRVDTEAERQRILQFHHRIWTAPEGYRVLQESNPVETIVLEIPRHVQATMSHGGLW